MDEPKYACVTYIAGDNTAVDTLSLEAVCTHVSDVFGPGTLLVSCVKRAQEISVHIALPITPRYIDGIPLPGWDVSTDFYSDIQQYAVEFRDRTVCDVALELLASSRVAWFSCTHVTQHHVTAFVGVRASEDDPRPLSTGRWKILQRSRRLPTRTLVISSHNTHWHPELRATVRREDFAMYCDSFSHCRAMTISHVCNDHVTFAVG